MAARLAEVNVAELYYTHARVRPFFSGCGRRLEDTLQQILSGAMTLDQLPRLTVMTNECARTGKMHLYCLNNRRLWVLKELYSKGYFSNGRLLRVRLKEATGKEQGRYTVERCSLTARMMLEKEGVSTGGDDGDDGEGEDTADAGIMGVTKSLGVFTVHTTAALIAAEEAAKLAAHAHAAKIAAEEEITRQADENAAADFAVSQGLDRNTFLHTYRRIAIATKIKADTKALDDEVNASTSELNDGAGEQHGQDDDAFDDDQEEEDPEPHKCLVCSKSFKEEKQLVQHMNSKPHKQALKDAKSSAKKKGK